MTYIDGFVIAVPTANKDKFIAHANHGDTMFIDFGATKVVECWGDDVPDGTVTDFRKAVQAKDDESIVFSWIEWPDKSTRDAGMARMMDPENPDPRMDPAKHPMPFDGKRMIYGGFEPMVDARGSGALGYVDGFVAPVTPDKKSEYLAMAQKAGGKFVELGALRSSENWGDDVPDGTVTDFKRSVKAQDGETPVFSWIEWPDKATRDAGWATMMADETMRPETTPFDGKRMFWGGFKPVVTLGE
ncbi:MAG: DUF1428 domain-containing protein [Alphaproteobacteria bacterium]